MDIKDYMWLWSCLQICCFNMEIFSLHHQDSLSWVSEVVPSSNGSQWDLSKGKFCRPLTIYYGNSVAEFSPDSARCMCLKREICFLAEPILVNCKYLLQDH